MNSGAPKQPVLIEGDGIAAECCARLLTDAGVPCVIAKTSRPKLAAVLLGEQTQYLLRELFPSQAHEPDLFAGFTSIRRRIVRWGQSAQPINLPHLGVVVHEEALLHRLWSRVPALPPSPPNHIGWSIFSSRSRTPEVHESSCGTRQAFIAPVRLIPGTEQDTCWVESVTGGWLFLLSLGEGSASLICVGDPLDEVLRKSTLIAPCLLELPTQGATAAAYPRMLETLAGSKWLACGTAAMSFDPLCGEGTGNAVREAFLAAAVVRAALAQGDTEELTAHYVARLRQGFLRHLHLCERFYSSGGDGDFWSEESNAFKKSIREIEARIANQPPPRYRLLDRSLERIEERVSAGGTARRPVPVTAS
jgi:hypothetical protein